MNANHNGNRQSLIIDLGPLSPKLNESELIEAVKTGDNETIKRILDNDLFIDEVNSITWKDRPLLNVAVERNKEKTVELLLGKGVSPNAQDKTNRGYTALHHASKNQNYKIIELLIKIGANLETLTESYENTFLHILCRHWTDKHVAPNEFILFLKNNNDIKFDCCNYDGITPLYMAAKSKWTAMAKMLIQKGANLQSKGGCIENITEILNKELPGLLEEIDMKEIETLPRFYIADLYDSMKEGNLEKFKKNIDDIKNDKNENIDSIFQQNHGIRTLMSYACNEDLHEFIDILLNYSDESSLRHFILKAADKGHYRVFEKLNKHFKEANYRKILYFNERTSENAFYKLLTARKVTNKSKIVNFNKCLDIILENIRYSDINKKDQHGNTPLHYAVRHDDQRLLTAYLTKEPVCK